MSKDESRSGLERLYRLKHRDRREIFQSKLTNLLADALLIATIDRQKMIPNDLDETFRGASQEVYEALRRAILEAHQSVDKTVGATEYTMNKPLDPVLVRLAEDGGFRLRQPNIRS